MDVMCKMDRVDVNDMFMSQMKMLSLRIESDRRKLEDFMCQRRFLEENPGYHNQDQRLDALDRECRRICTLIDMDTEELCDKVLEWTVHNKHVLAPNRA